MRSPRRTLALTLILTACVSWITACGGDSGGGRSPQGSSKAAEATPGVVAGSEAKEALAAAQRAAQLKKGEAAEEAAIKQKVEALRRAQAQASAAAAKKRSHTVKQHATGAGKQHSKNAGKQKTKSAKTPKEAKPKSSGGESPAEKAARQLFAKEEAQEVAAYRRRERQENAGR